MWSKVLLFLGVACSCTSSPLVQLTGKQLLKGKVFGMGYSIPVKSMLQCMDTCNEQASSCDGIVYHDLIKKCRMINKCAAAVQVDNTSVAVYFSKRPMIKADGYLHNTETDSCVGLLPKTTDYAEADRICAELKGRMVDIKSFASNKIASSLLRRSVLHWAWIGENNTGNNVSGGGDFAPEVLERSNGTGKGCWAINYNGQWKQFPCKNYQLPTLCEVLPFPS